MDDWKDAIRVALKYQDDAKAGVESRRQADATAADRRVAEHARFLKEIVRPALDEIKAELAGHGLQANVSETPQDVGLEVSENGRIRFSYRISGAGDACIRASGGSASIDPIPFKGASRTGEDIKRHFGVEFRSLFARKGTTNGR